jgi:WD40 repeat protein
MTSDYERTKEPHKLSVYLDVKYHKITNLALSPREDLLLFSTDTSQIISVKINLDKPSDEQFPYDYLVSSFHSKQIHGMDLCIKKQLMATCANDRSVRLWSYNTNSNQFKLELRQQFPEEAFSIAIHPSGFHMVVGF